VFRGRPLFRFPCRVVLHLDKHWPSWNTTNYFRYTTVRIDYLAIMTLY
jgi:hypothetical protein